MTDKLCCIILDALDPYNMRELNLDYVCSLYDDPETNAGLMGISGKAHTPISNAMLWGQHDNTEHIWVQRHPHRWTGGVDGFDPTLKEYNSDRAELYSRFDLETDFVWDVLDHHGLQASALGIPICLPPYSFNALDRLEDAWFPHTEEHLAEHVTRQPEIVAKHLDRGDDFVCTSIKVPDQWLHAIGSGMVDRDTVDEQVPLLEEGLELLVDMFESQGYDWLMFGDHGSPHQGRTPEHDCKKMLARHRKEAVIIGTLDDLPRYSDEMYPTILDYFGVEDVEVGAWREAVGTEEPTEEVSDRLESLGYL